MGRYASLICNCRETEKVVFDFILFTELFKVVDITKTLQLLPAPAENKAVLHNFIITNFKKPHIVVLPNNWPIFRSPLVHMSPQCP